MNGHCPMMLPIRGIIIYLTKGKTLVKGLFKPAERKEVDALVSNSASQWKSRKTA